MCLSCIEQALDGHQYHLGVSENIQSLFARSFCVEWGCFT